MHSKKPVHKLSQNEFHNGAITANTDEVLEITKHSQRCKKNKQLTCEL